MNGTPSDSSDSHPPSSRPTGATPRGGPAEPTPVELRASIRILLHIGRQGRFGPEETPTVALTQKGMAKALGLSQGAVSNALGRLVDGGVLTVERSHVRGEMLRLSVYQLTLQGEELVRRLRARFGPSENARAGAVWQPARLPTPGRRADNA